MSLMTLETGSGMGPPLVGFVTIQTNSWVLLKLMLLVALVALLVCIHWRSTGQRPLPLMAGSTAAEGCPRIVRVMTRGAQMMWSRLLGVNCGCLITVATVTSLYGRFPLMRFVARSTFGVTVPLLGFVAICAVAGGFGLRMALMASKTIRVPCVGPSRQGVILFLVTRGTGCARHLKFVRRVATRAILMMARQDGRTRRR